MKKLIPTIAPLTLALVVISHSRVRRARSKQGRYR